MNLTDTLANLFAPWQSLYSDYTAVSTTVTTVHIVTLLLAGGLAIAADRAALRAVRSPATDRGHVLAELGAVHRPVLIALSALFVSGLLLAAADIEIFMDSKVFWFKMGLIVLLLVNGLVLRRIESRLVSPEDEESEARLWRGLAKRARTSMALWVVITVAGTVLTNT